MHWDELDQLWTAIENRTTPSWAAGAAFEHLVLRCFQLCGARIIWPYSVSLDEEIVEQIDGMILFDHFTSLIEVKDTTDPISVEPIAKLRNQLLRRPAGIIGAVFSRAGFTSPARTLAQYTSPQAILLWSGEEVAYLLRGKRAFKESFARKFEFLAQKGIPDYDIRAEDDET